MNLPALEVRKTRDFLRNIIGLEEGRWIYPETQGELHHDEDSIAYFGTENRGLHVVRSVVSFARDNGFMHNPTIGGHFAVSVPDLDTVRDRLTAARIPYSDAGVYAMAGIHQIYAYDPSFNMVEINQIVAPLPDSTLRDQDPGAEIILRHAAVPAHDLDASIRFFRDVIGLEHVAERTAEQAVFRSRAQAIRLTRPDTDFPATDPTRQESCVALAVRDLPAIKERLDRAAIPSSGVSQDPVHGGDSLFVYAPSRRLMALTQA